MSILIILQDITTLAVDAIVNAANTSLLGGGGVDGAIHRAAGPQLLEACRLLNGTPVGTAKITPGFRLPAKWVIHAVGPVWQGGHYQEAKLLASAYTHCFDIAKRQGLKSIAFAAISTGIYGYPKTQAAQIALSVMKANEEHFDKIIACVFSEEDKLIYEKCFQALK
ncbi:MAG: O-acetyl-ADP-ribose deacetylase [Proteobacteria bacterium]|nr:O-acetyl-ADP-ribose deacetylase [Pseudomonadota bacterium]